MEFPDPHWVGFERWEPCNTGTAVGARAPMGSPVPFSRPVSGSGNSCISFRRNNAESSEAACLGPAPSTQPASIRAPRRGGGRLPADTPESARGAGDAQSSRPAPLSARRYGGGAFAPSARNFGESRFRDLPSAFRAGAGAVHGFRGGACRLPRGDSSRAASGRRALQSGADAASPPPARGGGGVFPSCSVGRPQRRGGGAESGTRPGGAGTMGARPRRLRACPRAPFRLGRGAERQGRLVAPHGDGAGRRSSSTAERFPSRRRTRGFTTMSATSCASLAGVARQDRHSSARSDWTSACRRCTSMSVAFAGKRATWPDQEAPAVAPSRSIRICLASGPRSRSCSGATCHRNSTRHSRPSCCA